MRFDNLHNHHLLTSPYKAACSATFVGKFCLVAAISRTKTLAMFSGCNREPPNITTTVVMPRCVMRAALNCDKKCFDSGRL